MNPMRSACVTSVLGSTIIILACGACGRQPDQGAQAPTSTVTSTSAIIGTGQPRDVAALAEANSEATMSLEDTARQVAETFCAHEVACDNVGPTRGFANLFDCQDRQLESRREAIAVSVCHGRLPKSGVTRCLDVLRGAPCTQSDEGASAIAVCRAGALCEP